jgi:hypothetical protein
MIEGKVKRGNKVLTPFRVEVSILIEGEVEGFA